MFDQTHDCNCAHCCLPTIVQERDEAMARLERACELLEDAADNSLYPGKRAIVRAFLAGEVTK